MTYITTNFTYLSICTTYRKNAAFSTFFAVENRHKCGIFVEFTSKIAGFDLKIVILISKFKNMIQNHHNSYYIPCKRDIFVIENRHFCRIYFKNCLFCYYNGYFYFEIEKFWVPIILDRGFRNQK